MMNQPKELKPLLVFNIFGRMGSTLMMQLLATSPQIAFDKTYPFEIRYLTYFLQWSLLLNSAQKNDWGAKENFKLPGQLVGSFPYPKPAYWNGQEFWKSSFGNIWREFSKNVVTNKLPLMEEQIIYYAEKVPFWLPEYLAQLMPYKIILLIRDPRDVFLSITAFDKKRGYSGFNRQVDDDDWSFAKKIVTAYRDRIKILYEEQVKEHSLLVKYEDLVSNLQFESNRLSQWLEVNLRSSIVESKDFTFHMTSKTPLASVGRWQKELSNELNSFFVYELGDELQYFGYQT